MMISCVLTENHLKNGDTDTDSKINENIAPLFSAGFGHRLDRHDVIETSVDTEGRRRDGNRQPYHELCTCVW